MTRSAGRGGLAILAALVIAAAGSLSAQVKEYDWYPDFRVWVQTSVPIGERSPAALAERYAGKLKMEGVPPEEIRRRLALLQTKRQELENDFWNRFFTIDQPTFNTEPNAFLASVVASRTPGRALDVGMGEGRNALFLAKLGWQVTGFDPADQAVALARTRARSMNLELQTAVALDTDFDFGRERWDLIVYSWVSPAASAAKAIESLRPGGIVVVEAGRAWFPTNALLKMFGSLRILHYEDRVAPSDFFNRREMPVVRLMAEKLKTP